MSTRVEEINALNAVLRPSLLLSHVEPESPARYVSKNKSAEEVKHDVAPMVDGIAQDRHAYNEHVACAAYFLAKRRGFEPGHELEDWLAAESEIGLARS